MHLIWDAWFQGGNRIHDHHVGMHGSRKADMALDQQLRAYTLHQHEVEKELMSY